MQEKLQIAVYGRTLDSARIPDVLRFITRLSRDSNLYIHSQFLDSLNGLDFNSFKEFNGVADFPQVDLLISIGGDGTLLDCVSLVRDSDIPIWGVNIGRLGFLTFTSLDDAEVTFDAILEGDYTIESRSMIEVSVDGMPPVFSAALNEVTVQKQDSSMVTVHAYIDNEFLGTYWADGVIVATPTGSTAYSLSIGGPIVTPDSNVFTLSPIAPHNLNMRPLVLPDTSILRLEVESRFGNIVWSMDNSRFVAPSGTSLTLHKSMSQIRFMKFKGNNFCINLRNKLLWGFDKRN